LDYLKKPQEWLARDFDRLYDSSSFSSLNIKKYCADLDVVKSSREYDVRRQIVSLNPAYYDKSLGADVPQLISVHIQKGKYPNMIKVGNLIKQPGALAPIEAILNPGRN